ncbi:fimbria/pilus outer membrane usher protein [Caballeronia sp. Lep1P3]|uniref:fimbria/pilus outer membrane usher protein n=1 Tax=Caballeronia sp. Lep1P3 TaxID=2878150 RepID=UPI001FD2450A|nr:fimbria/pilus outer membrane usher protein [Caballeronia sp. Lep1P3]
MSIRSVTCGRRRQRRRWMAPGALALSAACQPTLAQLTGPADAPAFLPAPASQNVSQDQTLVLEIVINGTHTDSPSAFELRGGQLYAEPQTLTDAGLRIEDIRPGPDGWIALSSIPGVRATYAIAQQQAVLDVTTERQVARRIGYAMPAVPKATPGTGFVLNYDATYQRSMGTASGSQLGVWSEQRLFTPFGVFDNTGTWLDGTGANRYTRLDTNWTYSNATTLFSMTVGDAISGSLPWSRSVRYGGIQIQRDFTLRPDLITYPLPMFAGSAAVPSAVDLYINGLRQYNGNVPPGPFQIAQRPSLTGAGVAQVVVTDALGRRVTTSVPLYVDTRLLAKGLYDYSIDIGFLREDYALRSWSYDSSPIFSGSFSYGASDWLTLQAHAETAKNLRNGGAGAVLRLGDAGVVNLAAAGSNGAGSTGGLASIGYQYIGPRFSVNLQGAHATPGYRDIASLGGGTIFEHLYQASVSMSLLDRQSATLSYIDSKDEFTGAARVVTLGYSAQLGRRWSLFASVYRDFAQRNVYGGSVGITFALGASTSMTATVSQSGGHASAEVNASRPADFSGGWGWAVQGGAGAQYRHAFAGANYRASFGDFFATAQRFNGVTTTTAQAAGALVVTNGAVLASRTLADSFALVATDGVANVPVLQENRLIGETNARGYLLTPDLLSNQRNQLAIDPLALPADAMIDRTRLEVAPQRRSGVLARFGMRRYEGASVRFVDDDGKPLPAGSVATVTATGAQAVVGYDGIAFFERLDANNAITISGKHADCDASVPFDPASASTMPQLGPIVCRARDRRRGRDASRRRFLSLVEEHHAGNQR